MKDLIEELTKVNPFNLSEEGLKLFNTINEIIDRNDKLAHELRIYKNETISKSKVREKIEEYDSIGMIGVAIALQELLEEE